MKVYVLPLLVLAGMASPALAVSPQVKAAYALAEASEAKAAPSLKATRTGCPCGAGCDCDPCDCGTKKAKKVAVKGASDCEPKAVAPVQTAQVPTYPQGYVRPVTYTAAPVYYYVQQPTYSAYRPPVSYSYPSYSYAPSFGNYGGMSRGFSMPAYSGSGYGGGFGAGAGACGPSG
jgi:hypothetical protein